MSRHVAEAYTAAAAGWERGPARVYERLAAVLISAGPADLRGARAVDIGTGSGAAARVLTDRGARVVATDSALGMLAERRKARPPAVAGDVRALPFRDNAFDLAVGAFVVNHLADPRLGLREMGRVAGTVLVSSFSSESQPAVKAALDRVLRSFGWTPPAWYDDLKASCAAAVATVEQLQSALEGAGLHGAQARAVDVDFADLEAPVLAAWRLWMPACAPFVEALPDDRRAELLDAAAAAVRGCPPVVLRMLIGQAGSAGEQSRTRRGQGVPMMG